MKYRYPVHVKHDPAEFVIPDLDARVDLNEARVQQLLTTLGREQFLKLYINDILQSNDANDADMVEPHTLDDYQDSPFALYLQSTPETLSPKSIRGKAILLTGTETERHVYFVKNKKLICDNDRPICISLHLSEAEETELAEHELDKTQPVQMTLENSTVLAPLLQRACTAANFVLPNAQDYWLLIDVDYESRNRNHYFEKYYPTLTTIALAFEWLVMIPITAGTLKGTEKTIVAEMDNNTLNYTSILQASSNAVMMLYILSQSPGAENIGEVGRVIDNTFHALYRFLRGNTPVVIDPVAAEQTTWAASGTRALKYVFAISMIHFIITEGAIDYVKNRVVKDNIEDPNALLPDAATDLLSFIGYCFNQFTDTSIYFGWLMFAMKQISCWMQPFQTPPLLYAAPAIATNTADNDSISIHTRLLTGIDTAGQRSPTRLFEAASPKAPLGKPPALGISSSLPQARH